MKVIKGFKLANAVLATALAVALAGCADDPISEDDGSGGGGTTPVSLIAAPAPAVDSSFVTSIFSDAYTSIEGLDLTPDWGQAVVATVVDDNAGENALFLDDLSYQGIDFSSNPLNVTDKSHLHVDYLTSDSTELKLTLISTGPVEEAYTFSVATGDSWNSVDIPLSGFSSVDLTDLIQVMFVGNGDVYVDNIYFHSAEDTTAPVITLLGDATVYHFAGDTYTDAGVTVADNVDTDLVATIGGDTVDVNVDGTYTITYDVSDAAGNAATQVTRTVIVSSTDEVAPVITLSGSNPMSLSIDDTYEEPGYSAMDNVDGDVSDNVVMGGDEVDTSTAGSYEVTYSVSDAAGNEAQMTRTVVVSDASDSIIVNGDFETALSGEWTFGEGTGTPTIIDGELAIVDLASGAASWQGRLVQRTDTVITEGISYKIKFDARAEEARDITIQVGKLLTEDPWYYSYMDDTAVSITTTMESYELVFESGNEWNETTDLIFGLGAGVDTLVTFDNISMSEVTAAEIPPIITLTGGSTLSLSIGDSYEDPGYSATDNLDGDVTSSVIVGGDSVDTSTAGSYTITYNVTDSDGNLATEATRTVKVSAVVAGEAGEIYTSTGGAVYADITTPGWDSGSSLIALDNTDDADYAHVLEWSIGTGWGGASAISFNGIEEDMSQFTTLSFKAKYTNTAGSIRYAETRLWNDGAEIGGIVAYETGVGGTWTELDNNWFQVDIPLADYGTFTDADQFILIIKDPDTSNSVYVTDVEFK